MSRAYLRGGEADLARARQLEIENARRDGQLCELSEAIEFVDDVIGPLKSELQGFAARITRDLELRQKIEIEINGVLARASDRAAAEGAALAKPKA